jgi:Flp pilus assembly protein TadG
MERLWIERIVAWKNRSITVAARCECGVERMKTRRRGGSLIEFALAAPTLLLLLAGVLNYAMALRVAIAVSDAARAGAQYGSLTPANAADTSGMSAAALNSAPELTGMTATASKVCKCAADSVSCSSTCASGPLDVYAQVTARATAPNWFRYPGLPFSGAVAATATMRAK